MGNITRIGMIGAGGIARTSHLPAFTGLKDRCEVAAICDPVETSAKAAAALFGVKRVFASHQEMIQSGELDAVIVATPNKFHSEPTLDALAAGLHVLCEKPLAMNGGEAGRMCAAARKAGKVLQVGLQARFAGASQTLKDMVDHGDLGFIYFARAQALRRRGVPGWGVFIDKAEQGGGPLVDIGVHILDLTLWLMGNPKPISATGVTQNLLGTNPALTNGFGDYDRTKFTVEDFAAGFIRFDNGAAVALESSFMANIEGNPFQTQLFGEKAGALMKPWDAADPLKIFTEKDRHLLDVTPANIPKTDPHALAATAFLDSIQLGAPCQVPGEAGQALNAIFDALYESAETGREVPVLTDF